MQIKIIALIAACCGLIFLSDFVSRILPGDVATEVKLHSGNQDKLTVAFLIASKRKQIEDELNKWDVVEKQEEAPKKTASKPQPSRPKPFIMGLEHQKQQQGALMDLFDGNIKYHLVATFNNRGNQYALIFSHDLTSDTKKNVRVELGKNLASYTLTKIHTNFIRLEHQQRVIELQLFNYKQKNNGSKTS